MSVSVRDVAQSAGVSVGTVSNVLNNPGKVAPGTVERVQRAIDELGFVRNDAARQLRAGRSRSIGLIVLDAANPFFAEVARGVERRAAEAGLTVLLGNSGEDADREQAYLDLFREQRVNGVLVTPTTEDLPRLERLRAAGVPVVLVDSELPGAEFHSVSVDDVEGGRLAASHLLSRGRRRLLFLGGPQSIRQVADRRRGAASAVAQVAGASLEVVERAALSVLEGRAAAEEIIAREPADRPDAIVAANDLLAMGALQALSMMAEVRVPDDIALVGYDDIDFAASAVVPLTSVRQPAELIGYTAADLLLADDEAESRRAVRFQPELVVRQSTSG